MLDPYYGSSVVNHVATAYFRQITHPWLSTLFRVTYTHFYSLLCL